jgi:hypothetical protein
MEIVTPPPKVTPIQHLKAEYLKLHPQFRDTLKITWHQLNYRLNVAPVPLHKVPLIREYKHNKQRNAICLARICLHLTERFALTVMI